MRLHFASKILLDKFIIVTIIAIQQHATPTQQLVLTLQAGILGGKSNGIYGLHTASRRTRLKVVKKEPNLLSSIMETYKFSQTARKGR